MTDFNAIERNRWGGPSPWAGKDSRTDVQKRDDQIELDAVRVLRDPSSGASARFDAEQRLVSIGWPPLAVKLAKGEDCG